MIMFAGKNDKDMILDLEKKLYVPGKVADKYDILETMRLELERLYNDNRPQYDEIQKALKPNTWEALEDNWKLWNHIPQSNAEWIGPGETTCRLKPSHRRYQECEEYEFTECTYDEHGGPDFSKVTFPGSVVDISDLYDSLSAKNIDKRGGNTKSFQEIAQMRMLPNLKSVISKWAKETGNPEDFWKWRNALNLLPHEDTNCRTIRLVYRPVHEVFMHRGGIANANNIKNHFE